MTLRPGDLVVLIGLPGAGKSTYAAQLQAQGALVVAYDGHRFDPARPRGAQPRELNYTRVYAALLAALPGLPGELLMVSNETGMGIVPLGELTRRYCDEAGRLHQDIAAQCQRVVLTVAGLPHLLKGSL